MASCEFSSAIWIKQSFWLGVRDILVADNGTLCVP